MGVTQIHSTREFPFISVIIPTYNRAHVLPVSVESFLQQSYASDKYEILLVDNNSTDATPQVLEQYAADFSQIQIVREPRPGAHHARNTGAKMARGTLLYFTDDDMLADPDLLAQIVKAFALHPQVGAASGKLLPKWEIEPPEWIIRLCYNGWMGLNDLGDELIVSPDDLGIFSGHEAVLPHVFFESGGFNPDVINGVAVGDNETGLAIKIKQLGYHFAYVGTSVIYHMIPKERLTQRYLNKRVGNQGNCDSYTAYRSHAVSRRILLRHIYEHFRHMKTYAKSYLYNRVNRNIAWHLDRAYINYCWNRIRYDYRLFSDENWRQLVLRSDWLHEE